jgi:Tol biopolymer transport system component
MRRVLAGVVVAGLCLVWAGPAWAVFPGQNGRIAYTQPDDGTIHTILPSGHGDTRITSPQRIGSSPSWSPNGRRIVFGAGPSLRSLDIYTMRADGSDLRRLTFDGGNYEPSYSPGGGRIVFGHNGTDTVVMRSDGSERHVIGDQGGARWTPNNTLTFGKPGEGNKRPSIWEMNPDGTHQHRLVRLGSDGGYGPYYSPDGSRFLFTRIHGDFTSDDAFLADADGTNIRQAPCQRLFSGSPAALLPLTYSPDGKWVLAEDNVPRGASTTQVLRISLGSCAQRKVLRSLTVGAAFDWQALPTL